MEDLAARVVQVIEQSGWKQGEFAALVGLDPPKLSKSLGGRRRFTSLEVALIAEQGGVTVDWLLTGRGAPPGAVAARAAVDDRDVVDAAVRRAEHLEELWSSFAGLDAARLPSPPLPEVALTGLMVRQGAQLAVAAWREVHRAGCAADVAGDLAAVLESVFGVDVELTALGDGLDGISYRRGDFRLALVSSRSAWTRQRFTLAHELGHLLAGDGELLVDRDVMAATTRRDLVEMRANAFAASFLMPEDVLRAQAPVDGPQFARLIGRLAVSPSALAWRLFSLGLVDAETRVRLGDTGLRAAALLGGWLDDLRAREAEQAAGRPCMRLLAAAMTAYGQGDIGVRPLAAVLDRSPEWVLAALEPAPMASTSGADAEEPVFQP
jgi:hypothetical protein